jgi:glycosyltransferase involved in cell wall biosynthesis
MTNKKKKKNNKKKSTSDKNNNDTKPFVSVCTPTFNRRPFISAMIKCFQHQTYPKDRMEWIIIDDGTDKIEDLVKHIPEVRYFKYDEKMVLGKKRNLMHSKAKGDFLVYMDDDDYYPPERISHSVETLLANPNALCAGSSAIYIYFKHVKQMYQFGPYGPTHATAGTFAFRKELLRESSYEETAALAEEKHFLKNYTVPFVQLDPMKTIIVFSHEHNTFDKRVLLNENMGKQFCKPLTDTVDKFIRDEELREFYTKEIDVLLSTYLPGKPSMKPDVLAQIIEIERSRRKDAEDVVMKLSKNTGITVTNNEGVTKDLTKEDIVTLIRNQQNDIKNLMEEINKRGQEIERLKTLAKHNEEETKINYDNAEKTYITGLSEQDKDNEIRRLHCVLLKLNENMLNIDKCA